MINYYQILGLKRTASKQQIKSAFKQLAFQYHPDRNPNNPQAEEYFKVVNEAYQTLSDDLKKTTYDYQLDYTNQPRVITTQSNNYSPPPPQTRKDHTPYENSYDPANFVSEKFKKRLNIYIISFFITVIVGSIILYQVSERYHESKLLETAQENFEKGQIKEAMANAQKIIAKYPHWLEAYELRANVLFQKHNYLLAIKDYQHLIKTSKKVNKEWYFKKAVSYFQLYEYKKALISLNLALQQDKPKAIYYYYRALVKQKLNFNDKEICLDWQEAKKREIKLNNQQMQEFCK